MKDEGSLVKNVFFCVTLIFLNGLKGGGLMVKSKEFGTHLCRGRESWFEWFGGRKTVTSNVPRASLVRQEGKEGGHKRISRVGW